ncbi:hypothetical protein Tco_0667899, partial [Tanacetum coccineum]
MKSPKKSAEKIQEEDVDTQEDLKEVVKENGAKRKKSIPRKSIRKRQKLEEDAEKEELKGFLDIIPREEVPMEVESLSTKFPIVDWKTCVLTENFMYYQVFRGDGSSKNYKVLSEMLEDFDRQDVEELYRLVKERYSASRPEGYDLMLWGDLHTLFELDEDDKIWKNQHEYNVIRWSLYDLCGIHILLMQNGIAIHMLTEKKYPLSQEMISKMLKRKLEVDHESSQAFELLRFIRSQIPHTLWYTYKVSIFVILDSSKVTNPLLRKESIKAWDQQTTQVIEDTHVIITPVNLEGQQQSSFVSSGSISNMLNPSPDIGIDSLYESKHRVPTSLVDVPVTTFAELPLLSATTLPPPPTPLITHLQQTPVPTPPTFNQTNQFAIAVSLIPGIVDAYLANKMHEAVKTVVQLQSKRLRDEAKAENVDFINKLDDNLEKIIKDQVKEQVKAQVSKILPKIKKTVNEQLEVEVLTRSSNESKTSHIVAANLSELELKKILIDKMESNKSIHKSNEQKNLYKALVDAYDNDEDKDEEPCARSNWGSKRRRAGKELESTSAPKEKTSKITSKSTEGSKSHHNSAGESTQAEKPMHTSKDLEEPAYQEFKIRVTEDQPNETSQLPDWFQKPAKPPTPDRDWNKTFPDAHGPVQPCLSSLAQMEDPRESFNELIDTPLDFSAFVMNGLKVDTLTPDLLVGLTFELMKGT